MKKNDLIRKNEDIFRVLEIVDDKVFLIDCKKKTMPRFYDIAEFENAEILNNDLFSSPEIESLTPIEREICQKRFTMIAPAISVLQDQKRRGEMIEFASEQYGISKQTLRVYIGTYLVFQSITALVPGKRKEKAELTKDQKNIRWALNKFFYTRNQNSLHTAYTFMLKEKYTGENGELLPEFPTFNQFRYFYRKTKKLEKYYIRREGIKDYQRNKRPLLGDGVQSFAPTIGMAMVDSTICDIHLVDDAGRLIGRPTLVMACDANTSLCLGYALLLEGGVYSLQKLILNVIENKVDFCKRMGIRITPEQWNVNQLPRTIITDRGSEFLCETFSQISELGVTIVNLPPYRPDSKGPVEKLFHLIQNSYKDVLKGCGVIMPDFQERGSHDYRKDASLTLSEFERIVVRCILYYNSERVIGNYPYTKEMTERKIKPYACDIWNFKMERESEQLISVAPQELILTLLPRSLARFTRHGLKFNNLYYLADGYTEYFLAGGKTVVAYNPDNCSKIWLKESDGSFVEFSLIESRFANMSFEETEIMKNEQKELVKEALRENYNARINLLSFIEATSQKPKKEVKVKGVREARNAAKRKAHKDIGGELDG